MKKVLIFDYSNVIFRTLAIAHIQGSYNHPKSNPGNDLWATNGNPGKSIPADGAWPKDSSFAWGTNGNPLPEEKAETWTKEEIEDQEKFKTSDETYNFWRYLTLNTILATIRREKPDEVVMAYDAHGGYWRHDVYSDYKGNRKEGRDNSTINFEEFFPIADEFRDEFVKAYPNFRHIDIPRCEADDICGILAKDLCNDHEIVLISNDKDYIQNLRYPNVRLYNPVDKKDVKSINPITDLDLKVITGDKGDNVPAIKERVGIKTAEKILAKGVYSWIEEQKEDIRIDLQEAYARNRTLIDLTHVPDGIQSEIITAYREYNVKKFNYNTNLKFLQNYKLSKLTNELTLKHATMLSKVGKK